jgi:hypothetical protein
VEDRNHQTLLLNLMAKKALKDVEVAKFVQNLGNLADNIQQMDQKLMNSQSFPSDGAHSVSGHLNVLVEKSTGVPTKHHDFYVSLKLTKFESEKASSVRHTKLASGACPQWNEEFVFLVEDRNHQTLLLNLMV